jgi:hypothetical protein
MPRIRKVLFTVCASLSLLNALPAMAQYGGRGGGGGGNDQQEEDDAKKKKRDEEFGNLTSPLPQLKNAGPCPFVKVLYDAARYIEFKDDVEGSAAVRYTGEIQNLSSICAYKAAEPIVVKARILFELGRGPQAIGRTKVYHYWVAVTDRNHAVIDKTSFDMPVTFPAGADRTYVTEEIGKIVIPRKDANVSGANFEVLVGFDVTAKMADFNRQGKRFRPNAGQVSASVASQP